MAEHRATSRTARLTANDPRLVQAWRLRAAGRLDEAAAAFQDLLGDAPLRARAHYGLAAIHWDRAQGAETEAHLREALALLPDDARGLAFLGCVRAASGATAEARELLGRIDVRRADPTRDCLIIGRLAVALGERGVAAQAYQRYLAARPNDTRAYSDVMALGAPYSRDVFTRVARRYPDLGLPRAAKAVVATKGQAVALAGALRVDPGNPLALWWMGKRLLREEDPAALGYLERAWVQAGEKDALAPSPAVATTLIEAFLHFGYVPEALAIGERALQRTVSDAGLLTAVATALAKTGCGTQAWTLVRQALNLQPNLAVSWRLAAELQAERGAWPQAVACARRAATLAPGHPDGWAILARLGSGAAGAARLWTRLGRWREAAAAWQAVVMVSPGESAGWRGLSQAWDRLGWTPARRRWLERWLPENRGAGAWLCLSRAAEEKQEAIAALEAALRVAQTREDWQTIAQVAMEIDKPGIAVSALEAVIAMEPDSREQWFEYGRALMADGQAKEALSWLRGGLAVTGDIDSWLLLADAEVLAGDPEAALRTLWVVVGRWPYDGQGWYQLATTLRQLGRHGRAAWALARYAERAQGLPKGERRAILAPLAGLNEAIQYYDGAWQPSRHRRLVYWRPPARAKD